MASPGVALQGKGSRERSRRRTTTFITHLDTSALLKLIVDEQGSDQVVTIWDAADAVASASLIAVEARAALAAAERAGRLSATDHGEAKGELARLIDGLVIVEVTEKLIAQAGFSPSRRPCGGTTQSIARPPSPSRRPCWRVRMPRCVMPPHVAACTLPIPSTTDAM
jgi:hypothetical protein